MNSFVVGAFYTKNTPYEEVYKTYLSPSLEKLKVITYFTQIIENRGSWQLNTSYKPEFVLNSLLENRNLFESVVIVDVDATINSYPKLFEEIPDMYDIGFHILNHDTWYRNGSGIHEVLSGTLWFRINEKTIAFVKEWCKAVKKTNIWEQKVLGNLIEKHPEIKVYELPLSYCYIKTLPGNLPPFVKVEQPVITHHQVSRQIKKWLQLQKYDIKGKNIKWTVPKA